LSSEYTIARYKARGKKFEILVDPERALEYKLGRRKEFQGILLFDVIYSDSKKGLKPSRKDLIEIFGTDDVNSIAKEILEKGELLIKAEQREKLIKEKRRRIISYISRYCVDSRTGAPLPPIRVERALKDIGVKIDPFKDEEEQIPEIISKLTEVIPIKKLISKLVVKVPAIYVGKAYGFVKNGGEIVKEEWGNDGSYIAELIIPAGLKNEFVDKLLNLTKGTAYVEVKEERVI